MSFLQWTCGRCSARTLSVDDGTCWTCGYAGETRAPTIEEETEAHLNHVVGHQGGKEARPPKRTERARRATRVVRHHAAVTA